jgi:Big-like domain-containing protein/List-Bact-rpt repeat protein
MSNSVRSSVLLAVIALLAPAAVSAHISAGFSDTVVFATNSAHLEQNSRVVSGDVVVNGASPGPTLVTGKELTVGLSVDVPAGSTLKADSLWVKSSADVQGDVFCNDLEDDSGSVTCSLLPLPVFDGLPQFFTGPSDGPDVTVAKNQTIDLAPGNYGVLTVKQGGVVRFAGGVYNLGEIDSGLSTSLLFLAPSQVRVAGKLSVEQDSVVGPAAGSGVAASEVVFYVAGINGTNGNLGANPKAAKLGVHATVSANFYVPNGTLWLRQNTVATGAFLGRDVDVGINVTLTLATAFFNRPPVAVDDSASVNRGSTVSQLDSGAASVLANDSDPDGALAAASLISGPSHASAFTFNANGTFSYTHDGGTDESDSFVYQVCDDGAPTLCDAATVTVVIHQNFATFAVPQTVDTGVDTPVLITLTGGAIPAKLPLVFSIVAGPAHGSVTQPPTVQSDTSARTTYSPESGFTGTDTFTFQVEDTAGGTATAVVTVIVSDETGSEAVKAVNQSVTTDQDVAIEIALRGTTTLEETVQITIATSPAHGALGPLSPDPDDPNAQLVTYMPASGYSGPDSFTFDACVSTGCDTGTISISVRPASLRVTIAKVGAGRVSSLPEGIDCGMVCSAGFGSTDTIFLFAAADEGSVFAGWSGDADCADGQLTPDGDKNCTATFDVATPPAGDVHVAVSTAGTGNGQVVSDPAGINCGGVCQADFPAHQRVELNATADPGSEFAGWSGSGDCLDGVLDGAGDVSCIATFNQQPATLYALTASVSGTGRGVVSISPPGISCSTTCTHTYAPGTGVRLTARADDDGSVFAGWSGDCVADPVFPFVATVTMNGNKVCSAVFNN